MRVVLRRGLATAAVLVVLVAQRDALGRGSASDPLRPPHTLELEPQLVAGTGSPPGPGTGSGVGLGARASWTLLPEGLTSVGNDSLALSLGVAFLHYRGRGGIYDFCTHWEPAPAGTMVCTEVPGAPSDYLLFPVQAQWNLWLAPEWSFLIEPGFAFYRTRGHFGLTPAVDLGGRYQIKGTFALTVRVGWPTVSIGATFQL